MASVPNSFSPDRCLEAVTAIETDLNRLTGTLMEAEFQAPTRTGGWSVAYCLEHLVLTGHAFLPSWDASMRGAAGIEQRNRAFPYSWWRRVMLGLVEPPYRLKVKTRPSYAPCSRRPAEEEMRRFQSMHKEIARRIEKSRGLDAGRIRVQSPFVAGISYPLGFSFDMALAHERRHLWQAWQVRRQLPSADRIQLPETIPESSRSIL